jgi:hypothetical protein
MTKPIILTDIEIEALECATKMWLISPKAASVSEVIVNLFERDLLDFWEGK